MFTLSLEGPRPLPLKMHFDINQINREAEAEQRRHYSNKIDDKARRLKLSRFNLFTRPPVAKQSRNANQHSRNHRSRPKPNGEPGRWRDTTLDLHPLPDSDSKPADRKTKSDSRNAGAYPRQKRSLIREMISRQIRVAAGWLRGMFR